MFCEVKCHAAQRLVGTSDDGRVKNLFKLSVTSEKEVVNLYQIMRKEVQKVYKKY